MMDCVDLRRYAETNDNFIWILNVIDTYTKHLWSFKLINKTSQSILDSLKLLFDNFGLPVAIQSDNGREFKNNLLETFLNNLNVKIIHGIPRNPKAQGQVEHVNQTIKRWLSKKLYEAGGTRWIDHHNDVVCAYNRTIHSATNKSPFLLFFGQTGFNNVLSGGIIVENDSGDIIPINDVSSDIILTEENEEDNVWDFNINLNNVNEFNESQPSVMMISDVDNKSASLASEVAIHFEAYKKRIIESKDSNRILREIAIGDNVLIKKDFDMNPQTKRASFESFYYDLVNTVVELLTNNMVELKSEDGEIRTVYKGILKLIYDN